MPITNPSYLVDVSGLNHFKDKLDAEYPALATEASVRDIVGIETIFIT